MIKLAEAPEPLANEAQKNDLRIYIPIKFIDGKLIFWNAKKGEYAIKNEERDPNKLQDPNKIQNRAFLTEEELEKALKNPKVKKNQPYVGYVRKKGEIFAYFNRNHESVASMVELEPGSVTDAVTASVEGNDCDQDAGQMDHAEPIQIEQEPEPVMQNDPDVESGTVSRSEAPQATQESYPDLTLEPVEIETAVPSVESHGSGTKQEPTIEEQLQAAQTQIIIPRQLKNPGDFRFIRVGKKSKAAIDNNWQIDKNYPIEIIDPILSHTNNGGNYGVMPKNDVFILDIDNRAVFEDKTGLNIDALIQSTFAVNGQPDRFHIYFRCPDLKDIFKGEKFVFFPDDEHTTKEDQIGDLRCPESPFYVVGSGSAHPDGYVYTIESDTDIVTFAGSFVGKSLLSKLYYARTSKEHKAVVETLQKTTQKRTNLAERFDLGFPDFINLSDLVSTGGGEYVGKHPIHSAKTGHNFSLNLHKGYWYCFNHGCGGGILDLYAQSVGVRNCGDVGAFTKEEMKQLETELLKLKPDKIQEKPKDKPKEPPVEKTEEEKQADQDLEEKAMEVLKSDALFDLYVEALSGKQYEMPDIGEALLLQFCCTQLLAIGDVDELDGIHLYIIGDKNIGKTSAVRRSMSMLPRGTDHINDVTISSLYTTSREEFPEGSQVGLDDRDRDDDGEQFLRRATSAWSLGWKRRITDVNTRKGIVESIPARTSFILTGIHPVGREDTLDRFWIKEVKMSYSGYEKRTDFIKNLVTGRSSKNKNDYARKLIYKCGEIIKTHLFIVNIPYGDDIIFTNVIDQRFQNLFYMIIASHAIGSFLNRDPEIYFDEYGRKVARLDSHISDFKFAINQLRATVKIRKRGTVSKVDEAYRLMANYTKETKFGISEGGLMRLYKDAGIPISLPTVRERVWGKGGSQTNIKDDSVVRNYANTEVYPASDEHPYDPRGTMLVKVDPSHLETLSDYTDYATIPKERIHLYK